MLYGLRLPVAKAGETILKGPQSSTEFGFKTTVLPNGNIVVADPAFAGIGAVYLYSPAGVLISKLTGF